MTVYARGYRPYAGRLGGAPPALVVAAEGLRTAWRMKAFKGIGVLYLIWFTIWAFLLYMTIGAGRGLMSSDMVRTIAAADLRLVALNEILSIFYTGVAYLTALLAVFVGAPLISDDLATSALPLYLVRPLRAVDYAIGKALVIPGILAIALLVPGFLFYALVGAWQPPGETFSFLAGHLEVPGRVVVHYLFAAVAYTGLILLLSSRTPRRTAAGVVAGVIFFGGAMLRGMSTELGVGGLLGDVLGLADLPRNTVSVFIRQSFSYRFDPDPDPLPNGLAVAVLAAVLCAIGVAAAWRRARTVEVTS